MQPIYVDGNSLLHRLHPLTKMVGALSILIFTYALPFTYTPLILVAIILFLAAIAGVLGRLLRVVVLFMAPLLISLVLIQGILFPPAKTVLLFDLGWYQIWRDGFLFALSILLRLLTVAVTVLLVLMTTHPSDLVAALTKLGLPYSIGYVLLVSLQIVPDMSARATAILEAQRSRGLETEGLIRRMRALPSLVGPLIVGALADVEERAMAIESRAFLSSGSKTTLRLLQDSPWQRWGRISIFVIAILAVVARFTILRGLV